MVVQTDILKDVDPFCEYYMFNSFCMLFTSCHIELTQDNECLSSQQAGILMAELLISERNSGVQSTESKV